MNRLFSALHQGQFRGVISPIYKKRKLIQLRGKDTLKFLNEVSTQRVSDNGKNYICTPSTGVSFLSPTGRVLFDNILYYRGPSNSFFIEAESERVPDLFQHLNKFRGKNGIFFDEEEAKDYNIWAFLATRKEHHDHYEKYFNNLSKQSKLLCYQDPRWPVALRLLVPKEQTTSDFLPNGDDTIYNDIDGKLYHWLRIVNGISEGSKDIEPNESKPLNANLDIFNALSFEGEYVGSNSIQYVKRTGIIRHRHMPFITVGKFKDIDSMDYETLVTPIKARPDRLIPDGLVKDNGEMNPLFDLKTTPPPRGTKLFPLVKTDNGQWAMEREEDSEPETKIVNSFWNGSLVLTELVDFDISEDVGNLFVTEENSEQILMKGIIPVWSEILDIANEEFEKEEVDDFKEGDYDHLALIQLMGEYGPTFEEDVLKELDSIENKLFRSDFGEYEGEEYNGIHGEFKYLF